MKFNAIVEAFFKKFIGPIWAAIKPTVSVLGSESGQLVLALAIKFVEDAATNPALAGHDGKARAAWVQEQIKRATINTGSPVGDSLINLAIEVALQKYKAHNQ